MSGFLKLSSSKTVQDLNLQDYLLAVGTGKNLKIKYEDLLRLLNISSAVGDGAPVYFEGNNLPTVDNEGQPLVKGNWVILAGGQTYTNVGGGDNISVPTQNVGISLFNGVSFGAPKLIPIGEIEVDISNIDTILISGSYRVKSGSTSSHQMQVVASSTGTVRQMRISANLTGIPYLEYRTYNPANSTWSSWADSSAVKTVPVGDMDNIQTTGIYRIETSNNKYLLEVSVSGNYVTQFRINPNLGGGPFISYRTLNNSDAEPAWTSWQDGRGIINIPAGNVETLTTQGLYRAFTETGSYFLQVQSIAGVIRQFRTLPNLTGVPPYNQNLPVFRYRDYVGGAWTDWVDLNFIPTANQDYNLITKPGVYYRNSNSQLPMLLIVNTDTSTALITQLRLYPSSGDSSIFQQRRSTDNGATWSNWGDILPNSNLFFNSFGNNLNTMTTAGIHKYASGSAYNWVQVAVSGENIRQIRVLTSIGDLSAKPTLVYRDKVGDAAWTAWQDAYNIRGFTGVIPQAQLDTLVGSDFSGIWYVVSTNPFFVQVVTSGGVTRMFRTDPNMSGEPRIVYRDYNSDTSSWGAWKTTSKQSKSIEPINEGIMWSWWIFPLMLVTRGSQDILHTTYTDDRGNTGVLSHPLGSQQYAKYPIKETILDIDDHNAGGIIKLSDGKMLTVFPTGHNRDRKFHAYRSKGKESFAESDRVLDMTLGGTTTYAQMLYINNVVYVFIRLSLSGTAWSWVMIKSSDNGDTWEDPKTILHSNTYQWYGIFRPVQGNNNLIKFVHYSNPTLPASALRGGYINIANNTVLDKDGITVVGNVGDNNLVEDFEIIIPTEVGYFNRLLDLKITGVDDWNILYCKFTTATDGVYRHYDNGTDLAIVSAGAAFFTSSRYYGGAVFGDNGIVYLSRNSGLNGTYFIDAYKIDGGSYILDENIHTTSKRAIRPAYYDGVLAWIEGHYNPTNFYDFSTRLNYKVIA